MSSRKESVVVVGIAAAVLVIFAVTCLHDTTESITIEGVLVDVRAEWLTGVVVLSYADGRELRFRSSGTHAWAWKVGEMSRVTVEGDYITRIEPVL